MTPMAQLKNQIATFKSLIGAQFVERNLNSAPRKSYQECWGSFIYVNKGVKSDFIKIFRISIKNENYSMAFKFKYLDLIESQYSIEFSIKSTFANQEELSSGPLSVNECREKFNSLNKYIELNKSNLNYYDIIDAICLHFLPDHLKSIQSVHRHNKGLKLVHPVINSDLST